jgi:stage III sporulation protein AD
MILATVIRGIKPEFLPLVRLGGTVLIFGAVLPMLLQSLSSVTSLLSGEELLPYAKVMTRALGVSLLTKLSCDACRDAGESGLADGVELAGRSVILLLSLPLVKEILGFAARLLESE